MTQKQTPSLRFPEFRGAWEMKRLGEALTSISNGLNLEQVKEVTSYKVTRIETISNDVINTEKVGYIKPEQDISSYKLNIGDMLYSNINSLSHIGRVVIIDRDYNLYHGMNLLRLVVDKNLNNPQFIYYLLNTEEIRLSFKSRANQAVNQASINQTELSKTRIIVPPLAEQKKIAACLSSLDEVITAQGDRLDGLKDYKRGLMQQLFPAKGQTTPTLRFREFQGKAPWEVKLLGDQGDFLPSLTGKKGEDFGAGNAKFIPYLNVFQNTFINEKTLNLVNVADGERQNRVKKGDVFFTVSSETPEDAGMSSVLLESIENCYLNSFCAIFRFSVGKELNSVFIGYLLRQSVTRSYLSTRAQGATRFNLSRDAFKNLPIYIPTPAEQEKIAECLFSLDQAITAQEQIIKKLKHHKNGLMQQLFPEL